MPLLSPWPTRSAAFSGGQWSLPWQQWLSSLVLAVNNAAPVVGAITLSNQTAAITTTSVPIQSVTQGTYRVTYDMRKTAVGASSSLTMTIGWTDGGVACSQTFTALTTNSTSATQSGSLQLRADANSAITYAVAYSSTGATLTYRVTVNVEQMP